MCKCGKNKKRGGKCSCESSCGSSQNVDQQVGILSSQVAEMSVEVDSLLSATKYLAGHPIIMIDDPDDLSLFDFGSGEGSDIWEGWAVCDGQSHLSPTLNKNINTPDLRDRFVVGAGGTYSVGNTGGAATVTLDIPHIPAHNHGVTDPGHDHDVTDPGHNHAITDPEHDHSFTASPHGHTLTIVNAGTHTHNDPAINASFAEGALSNQGYIWDANTQPRAAGAAAGDHTHTGNADNTTIAGVVGRSATGISVNNNVTNISIQSNTTGITTDMEGGGQAHENLPPYYALIFIKKIYTPVV